MFDLPRLTALAAAGALAVSLVAASAAGATTFQSTYYTINVAAPSPASSGLFVGPPSRSSRAALTLHRYQSGDHSLQWTPVNPEWPSSPGVTGSSPLLDGFESFFSDCFTHVPCAFHGSAQTATLKLVNRVTGQCMTIDGWHGNGTRVVQSACSTSSAARSQLWATTLQRAAVLPRDLTALAQVHDGQPRCLDAKDFQNAVGTTLQEWSCQSARPWNQTFRLLSADTVSCTTGAIAYACGLPASAGRP